MAATMNGAVNTQFLKYPLNNNLQASGGELHSFALSSFASEQVITGL
jgi:hypothetical protein